MTEETSSSKSGGEESVPPPVPSPAVAASRKREGPVEEITRESSRRRLDKNSSSLDESPRNLDETNENIVTTERMDISDADASFILGTGGRTKKKLARVSRADLMVKHDGHTGSHTQLELRGTPQAIDRARTYIKFVMQQRVGPVHLSAEVRDRDDLIILEIPHECVGYVTGARGQGLRSVEEEFSTLMFFTDVNKGRQQEPRKTEKLVIFSPCQRARQGAVLKVMSAIEQKLPGHFTSGVTEHESVNEEFDVDRVIVNEQDYSYALGRGGGTRKKIARASGAILEYIGRFAYIAGDRNQRQRARQYLQWLCAQRVGAMKLEDVDKRDDVDHIDVPIDCVAYVTGQRGQALRRMEEQTGTFMFLNGARGESTETLYIFGENTTGRARAKALAEERIDEKITGASANLSRDKYYDDDRARSRDQYRRPQSRWRNSVSPHSSGRAWQQPTYSRHYERDRVNHAIDEPHRGFKRPRDDSLRRHDEYRRPQAWDTGRRTSCERDDHSYSRYGWSRDRFDDRGPPNDRPSPEIQQERYRRPSPEAPQGHYRRPSPEGPQEHYRQPFRQGGVRHGSRYE